MKKIIFCLLTLILCSCATKDTPIIEKHVLVSNLESGQTKYLNVIATTAQRRVLIINSEGNYCAEPSPDAADNLLSHITASLKASADSGEGPKAELLANAARSIMSDAQFLIERTQGLQLFRDGSFALCTMHANGAITSQKYLEKMENLTKTSASLIAQELPLMSENRKTYLTDKQNKDNFETRINELQKLKEVTHPTKPEDPVH